jgi:4-carboxymuconolactone decarboxylase
MTDSGDFGDFGTFGRFVETPVAEMDPDTKSAYEYTLQLRGLVPGPQKIWVANPALARTIVPTGAYFQTESSLTKAEIEIVTSVINGRWEPRTATTSTSRSASRRATSSRRKSRR